MRVFEKFLIELTSDLSVFSIVSALIFFAFQLYQTLYYGDDELNDSFTIEEYEIENGATLKLQVQDKNSGKPFADAPATFAIDERTYNLLFDETGDAQKKQAHSSASLTDSKSIDEFRMANASSNLGCISVNEQKIDELDADSKKELPHEKRQRMEQLLEKMQKWGSKFNRQAIKLPNLNGSDLAEKGRRSEFGSSNSLNGTSNLSIPNSLSSPNNLTVLGGKNNGKEPLNEGKLGGEFAVKNKEKRLSNQFEKKNFSVKKGFQFFPRFRSNSSFNLVVDYEARTENVGKQRSEFRNGGIKENEQISSDEKLGDLNRAENRPSSVPHASEKLVKLDKPGSNKLVVQQSSADISKKAKSSDPKKKSKKAKKDNADQNAEKSTEKSRDQMKEASDRLKALPRKLPPVEVANKEKTKSQKCPKCKKKQCK